ncbi:MAG: hypothetical protein WKF92_15230 [Pyrinomonadaceae bacterium]
MHNSIKIILRLLILSIICIPNTVTAQKSVAPKVLRQFASLQIRDSRLEAKIRTEALYSGVELGNAEIRYYYNRVDLNGDGNPEVLVYLYGDYQCGTGGCDILLFSKTSKGYKLLINFEPTRNPVVVSENKTNGWRDLIFFNVGGGILRGYYSVVRHDGQGYPDNPTVKRVAPPLKTRVRGVAYLVGEVRKRPGIRLGR